MKIAILDDYQSIALKIADWGAVSKSAEIVSFADHIDDQDLLVERLMDFEVLVLMRERTPVTWELIQRLPNLQLLVTTGPFNAVIDLAAAQEARIVVCATSGYVETTVELAWALILAIVRHVPEEAAAIRRGEWQHTIGVDLRGKTLGLIGLGNIGSRMVRVGSAFGMSVSAWSEHMTEERAQTAGATAVTKETLFRESDIISIHLVQSSTTIDTVGHKELQSMKPTAFIVNTSRGPIINEGALIEALRQGLIAGAALDVFDHEPLPANHPFRTLPNVVATPHIGYVTETMYEIFYREVVEDILAFLAGSPIRTI